MRFVIALTAFLAAALLTAPSAEARRGEWCLFLADGATTCGFTSQAQCLATAWGEGGSCTPDML